MMINSASAQAMPQTTEDYEAAFDRLMAEAEHLNELMRVDRLEIERLKSETKVIREETRSLLVSIGAKL